MDDVSLRILWDRIVSVTNEASVVLKRSAFSTLVRECNDFACSLMTPEGETLAIADAALPSFSTTQSITLKAVLDLFPIDDWSQGDIVITNDPWIGTGQVMDLTILKPVFRQGRVVAFTGSVAHSPDLGGMQRWNGAKDVFEEGMFISPIHLYKKGRANDTLFQLLRANSRVPDETIGDLMAQLASHEVGEKRLLQVMNEHNLDDLQELSAEIFSRSEQAIRAAIHEVPDGEFTFTMVADGSSGGPYSVDSQITPEPMKVLTRIRVHDTDIKVDFSDSSPQVEAPINSVYPFTFAYAAYALRLLLVPFLPQNGGFLRPMKIVAKEGTIMNASYPSPTLNRGITGHLVCDSIFAALSEVIPGRVRAMSGSTPLWQLILIGDDEEGRPYQRILPLNGGLGGTAESDGVVCSFPANLTNVQIEVLELSTPILCEKKEILTDSAGAGSHRGGYGVKWQFRASKRAIYSMTFNRVHHPPQGLLGGQESRPGKVLHNGRELEPGAEGVLQEGDTIIVQTPGGGGFGLPERRAPELIRQDLASSIISPEVAESVYGYVDAQRSWNDELREGEEL